MTLGADVQESRPEMALFRVALGQVLRDERMRRGLTLRALSDQARVSLGYISEIERGHKEASSELLAALCEALDIPLSEVISQVSDAIAVAESLQENLRQGLDLAAPTSDVVVAA